MAYRLKTTFGAIWSHVGEKILNKGLYQGPNFLNVYP